MKKQLFFASLLASCAAHAVEINKEPAYAIADVRANAHSNALNLQPTKPVRLMNFKLSTAQKKQILQQAAKPLVKPLLTTSSLPSRVELGMSNVPVLDQGFHGSCVTFASTAALDALVAKGDYISQLCNLSLGKTIEENGYTPSGWDGSWGPLVLNQLAQFGFVSKDNQRSHSCAGVYQYPLTDENDTGNAMNLKQFKALHENFVFEEGDVDEPEYIGAPAWDWVPVMNAFDRFSKDLSNREEVYGALLKVKQSLSQGNRVVFGTLIVTSDECGKVACGSYKAKGDSWVSTTSIDNNPVIAGGHEMVITGYDDNAAVFDADGKVHMGLLKLRNSWGSNAGDNGNYYMSYEYFIKYSLEVQNVISLK